MNSESPMPEFKTPINLASHDTKNLGSRVVQIVCYFGLGVANYYSWTMTATGFLETKLLPNNAVMAASVTPFFLAGFVQLGILCFYLTLARFTWRKAFLYALASIMVAPLITITIFFSLYAVTFTSEGDKLVAYRNTEIKALAEAIPKTDAAITLAYQSYIGSLQRSRQLACEGREGSNVAICGKNAMNFEAAAVSTSNKYASSLDSKSEPSLSGKIEPTVRNQSVSDDVANLDVAYSSLVGKFNAYKSFAEENGQSTAAIQSSFDNITTRLKQAKSNITATNTDKSGVVLDQVIDGTKKFFQRRGDSRFALNLIIALLPDFLSWLFSILLLIVRPTSMSDIPNEGDLRRKTKIWRRLSELSKEQYTAWRAWADDQMKWRVEREVHKSFEENER